MILWWESYPLNASKTPEVREDGVHLAVLTHEGEVWHVSQVVEGFEA